MQIKLFFKLFCLLNITVLTAVLMAVFIPFAFLFDVTVAVKDWIDSQVDNFLFDLIDRLEV